MSRAIRLLVFALALAASGCARQVAYQPEYLPDEAPEYVSSSDALLVMADEQVDHVFTGSPSSFTGGSNTLTIPLGQILKEAAEEVLRDRFAGRIHFAKEAPAAGEFGLVLRPAVKRFDHKYNQLKNLGVVITPQVEIDLDIEILDQDGEIVHARLYESGVVSGGSYMVSMQPAEKINRLAHEVMYDLVAQSFEEARPVVLERLAAPE